MIAILLALQSTVAVAADPSPDPDALSDEAWATAGRGDFAGAIRLARRVLDLRRATLDPDDPALAYAYTLLGTVLHGSGQLEEARAHLEQARAVLEARLAPGHPRIAQAVHDLAALAMTDGDLASAEAGYRQAIAMRTAHPRHDPERLAASRMGLADVLYARGMYAEAAARLAEALPLLEGVLPADHPALGQGRQRMARIHLALGERAEARAEAEAALGIYVRSLGPRTPHVAGALVELAELDLDSGSHDEAIARLEQAIDIYTATLGAEHAYVGTAASDLALALTRSARYDEAEALFARAHDIAERANGPDHPLIAKLLVHRAELENHRGRFTEAEALLERGLALADAAVDGLHPARRALLVSLAESLRAQGDHASAWRLLEEAAEVARATHGSDHPATAVVLAELAGLRIDLGDPAAAVPLLEGAIPILAASYGAGHPTVVDARLVLAGARLDLGEVDGAIREAEAARGLLEDQPTHPRMARTLLVLGEARAARGDLTEARQACVRARDLFVDALGPEHPAVADALQRLADVAAAMGELDAALTHQQRAVEVYRASLGPEHPAVAPALGALARLEIRGGARAEARAHLERALDIATLSARRAAATLGERDALRGARTVHGLVGDLVALRQDPDDALEVWSLVLQTRALATRLLRARAAAGPVDAAHARDLAALARVRRRLAEASVSAEPASLDELKALEAARARLELATAVGLEHHDATITPAQVCAALDGDPPAALVSFRRYGRQGEARFAAFVVDGACTPVRVDLGPAADLEVAVTRWTGLLPRAEVPVRTQEAEARAGALLWAPLAPHISHVERLLVVPDGVLARVPWAALPTGDGLVLDHHVVASVDHPEALLRPRSEPGTGLLLVGDVAFDGGGGAGGPSRRVACLDQSFPGLPGTADEIEDIERLWRRRRREPVDTLRGTDATETRIRAELGTHRVVHLATHGFFAGEACGQGRDLNPMLLSGLAVAGVNHGGPTLAGGDGLLTAEELAGVDMSGTELVVLSACDTALGRLAGAEGVLGLRRALAASGAGATVMSLWSVDDAATARLMERFYRAWMRRDHDAAAALATAQRDARRAGISKSTWAAFVASGGR